MLVRQPPVALATPPYTQPRPTPARPIALSFAQVIKAAEPAFAAAIGFAFYGSKVRVGLRSNAPRTRRAWNCSFLRDRSNYPTPPALPQVSTAKLLMLVPVIGGIVLASVSELDFTWACLAAAGGANVAAAFRGQENKKAMAGDMNAAIGGGANAYAIGTIWSTLLLIPTIFISGEYQKARKGVVGWGRGLGTVSEVLPTPATQLRE